MFDSLFKKVAGFQVSTQETSTQVRSRKHCEIFRNNYFEEHMRTSASTYFCLSILYIFIHVLNELTDIYWQNFAKSWFQKCDLTKVFVFLTVTKYISFKVSQSCLVA